MDYQPLSRQILENSLKVKKGERVWINGWDHTARLVSHLVRECRRRGCEAVSTLQSEKAWLRGVKNGPIASLEKLTPKQISLLNDVDAYIFTLGPRHPLNWSDIPQERRRLATIWLLEDNEFVREWKSLASRRKIRMLGIEATLATKERAKALEISFRKYTESMYSGCLADSNKMARLARKFSVILHKASVVRITTPKGTDFQFRLNGRPVEVSHGLVTDEETRNGRVVFLPAGAVGTTIDEESAKGVIVYDYPIRRWNGVIEGLRLRVKDGRIISYTASRGANAFEEYLESNGAFANRFAFVGFGLNSMLKLGYTQDDKVMGSIELNFGENESRGGRNKGGRNFWGVVTQADVTADAQTIMKSGSLRF